MAAVTVEITRRAVLRAPPPASAHGGGGGKHWSPLTPFDRASTDGYIPNVFAWNAPAPDNDAIVDGLLAAVARYPHLAARIVVDDRGRKCFHLSDAGVLVVEATADADLADAPLVAHVSELYPKADKERVDEPLFQVQLTRYRCGGLVIGTACQHLVADGQSITTFYTVWATAVRRSASATDLRPLPFTDRAAIAVPRSPPMPKFDHQNIEFRDEHSHSYPVLPMDRIKNISINFPEEFIAGLKARVSGGRRCTTFQCLLAHVWKKVTAARDLAPEEFTQIRVAVNCRGRAVPPVPMEYFGNMVLWAFPRMRARQLLSSSYAAVVGAIRDAVARVDAEYIQSFVDFGDMAERAGGDELASTAGLPGMAFCPDLEVDSWLGFRFHDLDFGYGPPCAFVPPDQPVEGLMILVPSCAARVASTSSWLSTITTLMPSNTSATPWIDHRSI